MNFKQSWRRIGWLMMVLSLTLVLAACPASDSPVAQEATPAAQEPAAAAPAEEPTATTAPASDANAAAPAAEPAASARVFTLDQTQSEARFTLDEELAGVPTTVVGVTKLVSGDINIDLSDMSKTTISPIQIDARDFRTDSSMRNGAIQRFILQTGNEANQFILFTPTTIEGLPQTAKAGDSLTLKIIGDLTISGVTKPATFEATVNAESETQLSGLAKTQVLRSDYNLQIPSVPRVANVTDEVLLELQFVATAQ